MINKDTYSLNFYLKGEKARKSGDVPIYARIMVNGSRVYISTSRFILPEKWNKNAQRAKGTTLEAKSLNSFLNDFRYKIQSIYDELYRTNQSISAGQIKNIYLGVSYEKHQLLDFFAYHNKLMKGQIGTIYSEGTYKRYETTLGHIKNFIQDTYHLPDIPLEELDYGFIQDLEMYFRTKRNCNNNTTVKYIRNLKKVVNLALRKGFIAKDPFMGYTGKLEEVKIAYLTKEELAAIEQLNLGIDRLAITRDLFVFACYTGLAYIDITRLQKNDIGTGIDGEKWILINRHKTRVECRIPLLTKPIELLKKYEVHPECADQEVLLPARSNQKLNAYLKEIAVLAGIDKNLTFHVARHTFATTITLTNDVPIESVSKMLGHKTLRSTQGYAKVADTKLASDMGRLRQKLSELKPKDANDKDEKYG